ncbi:Uncharacterised protein [Serratia ficaria]|nr:Uncharacterised protein [Serratia ficaria]
MFKPKATLAKQNCFIYVSFVDIILSKMVNKHHDRQNTNGG